MGRFGFRVLLLLMTLVFYRGSAWAGAPPVSLWKGDDNAIDSTGSNNGELHSIVTVSEGSAATATCSNGTKIIAYSSLYGTNCSTPVSCGSCDTSGASGSCTVTFNNSKCTDPCSGTAKQGTLDITCGDTVGAERIVTTADENSSATATCGNGRKIATYSSLYGTNCSATPVNCGSCDTTGASGGCTVTFNNATCGDPCPGVAKQGTLDIGCGVAYPSGKTGHAFGFGGVGNQYDYIKIANDSSLDVSANHGIAFWVNLTSLPSTGKYYYLLNKWKSSSENKQITIDSSGYVTYALLSASGAISVSSGSITLSTGSWHHVAATYDGSNMAIYVDGIMATTTHNTGAVANSSGNLYLAYNPNRYTENSESAFNGLLDEVMWYNRTLSANEIQVMAALKPDAFSFTPRTGVMANTYIESNAIAVTSIYPDADISIRGGEYAISTDGGLTWGSWSAISGVVGANNQVKVRQLSSDSPTTKTTATLTIGSVSGEFDVTTVAVTPGNNNVIVYAKPAPCGTGDCSSWANACTLRFALAGVSSGNQIWVAAGKHKPTAALDRNASFTLKNGVNIYGGFAGTETGRDQRDIAANVTILSGDLKGDDGADFANNGENSYRVVSGADNVVLDGVTISGGNGNDMGGGMYNKNSSPTLANVTFSGNYAYNGGGGMYNENSSPTLNNVTFSGNGSYYGGGGMVNVGNSTSHSTPTLTDVTFNRNSTTIGGGGMANSYSNPTLTNVTFSGNSTNRGGGGMSNYQSIPTLTSVTFSGNSHSWIGGGGMNNIQSTVSMTNNTFNGNSPNAIETDGSITSLRNSIMWGDSVEVSSSNGGSIDAVTSIVQGGCPSSSIHCVGVTDTDPLLGHLGNYGGVTQTIPVLPGSPAIDAAVSCCPPTDQRGVPLSLGAHCDFGAFHSQGFTITKNGGDNQRVHVNAAFPLPLSLTVSANNNAEPVDGGVITFAGPASGAGTANATYKSTIGSGVATASVTANGTVGSYNVTASSAGAANVAFALTNSLPPVISGISPSAGPAAGGTDIIISGNYFTGATVVNFGTNVATSLSIVSDIQATAKSPSGVTGQIVDVTLTTDMGTSATTSADQFTYTQNQARNINKNQNYATLAAAILGASEGDELHSFDSQFDGNIVLDRSLFLRGGYDSDLVSKTGNKTTLNGSLTVTNGSSTVEGVIVKGTLTLQAGSLLANDLSVQ